MSGVSLWRMISDLEAHPGLSDDDLTMLNPAFEAIKRHEVILIPDLIVGHVQRLHERLIQQN